MAEHISRELSERLDALAAVVGPAGRRVLAYIEDAPIAVLASTATELAGKARTSDATVIRTVQGLGFKGLPELKQALLASVGGTPASNMRQTLADISESREAVDAVIRAHEEGLAVLGRPETRERLLEAASTLSEAGRILVFGIGPSAPVAGYASSLLNRAGRISRTLDRTGSMLADQLLDLRPTDAFLCLAYGKPYREIEVVMAEAVRHALPVVLVTDTSDNPLGPLARCVLTLPRGRPGQLALHGLTVVALEALVLSLVAAGSARALSSLDRLGELRTALARGGDAPAR